ncbi:MAG: S41 family peptidase [Magnetovibrionaceae bacterium]
MSETGGSKGPISDFTPEVTATVIGAGLDLIQERYIEPVRAGDLAISGLSGLGVLEPSLVARRADGLVRIAVSGQVIAEIPDDELEDEAAWAVHLALTLNQLRLVSPAVATARSEQLYEAVFDGILSDLDVFSRYAGSDEATRNRDQRDGFDGIGISFRMTGEGALITSILPQTPAARAQMTSGDVLLAIDGHPLARMQRRDVADLLRGPIGSKVKIKLKKAPRPNSTQEDRVRDVTLLRKHIVPETVTAISSNGIVGFRVSSFNQETADRLAERLKAEKQRLGPDFAGVVLDLRGNPGGLLRQSVKIADLFLKRGPIVSTQGRHRDSLQFYEAGGRDLAAGKPMVVLVDGRTASAAEVVAAALQDRGRAAVIGTTSFGKGTVQTVSRLPNNGELTLTWSRLVAPSGYIIHGLGVVPKVCLSGKEPLRQAQLFKAVQRDQRPDSWRLTGFSDPSGRRLVRDSCPPEDRNQTEDWQTAIDLIRNPGLYERALDGFSVLPPVEAPQAAAVPAE